MIASSPVRGRGNRLVWRLRLVLAAAAMIAGAVATGAALHALLRTTLHPGSAIVGAVAAICAIVAAGIVPNLLPSSRWMIPQVWFRFGPTLYPLVFGAILGIGFVTVMAAAGYYTVAAAVASLPAWWHVVLVFGAFGAARAAPFVAGGLRAIERDEGRYDALESMVAAARRLEPVEIALLASIAVAFLA